MTYRIALRCLPAMLLCLLITSPPNVIAQGQGDIPVVNPTNPGGSTTSPTITQPSPPLSTFPGPTTTTPTGGYPPIDGTTPTGGYPPLDGNIPIGGGGGDTGGGGDGFGGGAPGGGAPGGGAPVAPGGGGDTGGGGGGGGIGGGGGGGGGQWCVAKPNASPTSLQVALDYACGYGGADCGQLQQGASCYEPNNIHDHASFAFNSYYQKHPGPESCVFGGAAQLTNSDPSKGNCHFPSSSGTTSSSPPFQSSPPDFSSPPSTFSPTTPTFTPPTMGIPGNGPPFGVAEPTGLPSSATLLSHSLLPIFTAIGILMPLLRDNYL